MENKKFDFLEEAVAHIPDLEVGVSVKRPRDSREAVERAKKRVKAEPGK